MKIFFFFLGFSSRMALNRVPEWKGTTTRSNLRQQIKENWLGETNSIRGLQYLNFQDGVIRTKKGIVIERTDVLQINWNRCVVFVEASGEFRIDAFDRYQPSSEEFDHIDYYVRNYLVQEKEHVEREKHFLESRPWKRLDGLTPEQAIEKLTELGF